MKAYVIALEGHAYSQACAERCIKSAAEVGKLQVDPFRAVDAAESLAVMQSKGLRWTWGKSYNGLNHHDYGGNLFARIGCAMSHYTLWERCVESHEELLILEHDAVFIAPMPEVEHVGICQINDPKGATPHGAEWSRKLVKKGPGVHNKTLVMEHGRPDGLAGNSAYLIKPHAAQELIRLYKTVGVWPNDATMCVQFFPYLQEYFPYITKVEQLRSTSSE